MARCRAIYISSDQTYVLQCTDEAVEGSSFCEEEHKFLEEDE